MIQVLDQLSTELSTDHRTGIGRQVVIDGGIEEHLSRGRKILISKGTDDQQRNQWQYLNSVSCIAEEIDPLSIQMFGCLAE